MFLPPELNTKERRAFDMGDLRVYYLVCEDLGIADEEHIQKSFYYLMKWAGKDKFSKETAILKEYITKVKKKMGNSTGLRLGFPPGSAGYIRN
jgi:hypothetical protein